MKERKIIQKLKISQNFGGFLIFGKFLFLSLARIFVKNPWQSSLKKFYISLSWISTPLAQNDEKQKFCNFFKNFYNIAILIVKL